MNGVRADIPADTRGALEALPDGIVIVDSSETIQFANELAKSLFGYSTKELVGQSIHELVPPELRSRHHQHVHSFGEQPTTRRMGDADVELLGLREDGTKFPLEISLSPITISGSNMTIAAIRDASDRRRYQRKLSMLATIRQYVLTSNNLDSTLNAICREGQDLLGAAAVTIVLPVSEDHLEIVAGATLDGKKPARALIPTSEAFVGVAFTSGERKLSDDSPTAGVVGQRVAQPILSDDGEVAGLVVSAALARQGAFTADQLQLVESLALEVRTALRLERIRADRRQFFVVEDRERIARDLHDVVIQRLFATGMGLQSAIGSASLQDRVVEAIDDLDDTIKSLRNAIFGLVHNRTDFDRDLDEIINRYRSDEVHVDVETKGQSAWLPQHLEAQVLAVTTELLSNACRHGAASVIDVELVIDPETRVTVRVTDDGVGLPIGDSVGLGTGNLQARAEQLNGTFNLQPGPVVGVVALWSVPLE